MRFEGKTPGKPGVEPHHGFFPGTDREVAIIAVQVQLEGLVGGKRELKHRPLCRPYRPVRAVDAAAADHDRKSLGFRRRNLAWGIERAEQDRPDHGGGKRMAGMRSSHGVLLAHLVEGTGERRRSADRAFSGQAGRDEAGF